MIIDKLVSMLYNDLNEENDFFFLQVVKKSPVGILFTIKKEMERYAEKTD